MEVSKNGWPKNLAASFSKKYYDYLYLNLSTQQLNNHQPTIANALNTPSCCEAVSLCRGIGSSLPWIMGKGIPSQLDLGGLGAS